MSSTSQPTDFSDLQTDLLNRIRADTSVAATVVQAKRYVNIALHDMHIGFDQKVPWAERRATLVTQQDYSTGTLAVSQGDTALTGTDTLWNTNNAFGVANVRAGGKIVISGGVEVYEIASVSSDTGAVLTSDYVKSDETAATYVYFEDEYALDDDFLRPVDITNFDTNGEIGLVGRNQFRLRYPRNKTPGKPRVGTIIDLAFSGSTSPRRYIKFHQPPNDFFSIPYRFITDKLAVASDGTEQTNLSADADEPIVPLRYRHAIIFHALYHWYRDKKDDDRASEAKSEYTDLMVRISGDIDIGASRPQIRPVTGPYKRRARRPWAGKGRRHTLGTAFDELRE